MLRLWILPLLAACSAKTPTPSPAAAQAKVPTEAPVAVKADRPLLLWRVERDDAVSHLLGTCHLPIPLDHALPDPHKAALDDARVLYTELRVDSMGGMSALDAMWRDESLKDELGPEAWQITSLALRKVMPAPALDHMPGWAAYSLVSTFKDQDLYAKITEAMTGQGDEDAIPLLDLAVELAAKDLGLEHRALETADEQFAVLNTHDAAFVDALKQLADGSEADEAASNAMAEACFQGSISALEGAVEAEQGSDLMAALLDERNARWVTNLQPELEQGGVLVAAGAAHMIGPSGLITAFEQQGYTVTALQGVPSDWEAPDLDLGGAGLERPEVDQALVDSHLSGVDQLAQMVCAPQGPVAQCMLPDADTCVARMKTDAALCIEQLGPDLPANPADPMFLQRVLGCAGAGVTMEAMITDSFGEGPICEMMRAAMQQAQGAMGAPQ